MTPRIKLGRDQKYLTVKASPREVDLLRTVPGLSYAVKVQEWRANLNWGTVAALWGIYGEQIEWTPEILQWVDERNAWARTIERAKQHTSHEHPVLYPYQTTGVTFLRCAEKALLGDDMGLGKTLQVITALSAEKAWPALIVCPNSLKQVWVEEFTKWAPSVVPIVVGGSAAKRRAQLEGAVAAIAQGSQVAVIINYEAVRLHSNLAPYGSVALSDKDRERGELNLIEWEAVVCDEAHRIKDPKAKQTRAVWAAANGARVRYAMTGTPINNSPADLWAVMHFVNPDEWPTKGRYLDRYTLQVPNFFGALETVGLNPATEAEFRTIFEPRFLRRTKGEVLPELPAKTYSTRYATMSPKQAKVYKDLRKESMALVDGKLLVAGDPLVKLGRMLQASAAYPVLDDEGGVAALTNPSCKVDALLDLMDDMPNKPLVVFAHSRKLLELAADVLGAKGVELAIINGTIPTPDRQMAVAQFQAGDAQVALVTLGAGAEGITLTAADTAVFLQRSYSLVQNKQAEDRIHRIGQDSDKVEIIDIVTEGTIESRVLQAVLVKEGMLQQLVHDPGWWEES